MWADGTTTGRYGGVKVTALEAATEAEWEAAGGKKADPGALLRHEGRVGRALAPPNRDQEVVLECGTARGAAAT